MNRWWVWCIVALLAGVALGWASPPPPLPKAAASDDTWSLPAEATKGRTPQEDTKATALSARWDGEQEGGGVDGPWRLAGIASGPVALLELLDDKKIVRLARGAELPGNSTLLHIGPDRIRIERDGCLLVYQLYHSEPVSSEGTGCPEIDTDAAAPGQTQPGPAGAAPQMNQ